MVPEILNGMLWQVRVSIRTAGARAFAAHGYVDPSYRPPRLPFVSVVGPLSLQVEPERENGRAGQAMIRVPGHVIGQPRPAAATVPATGRLRLRFDGRASVTLALAGLPATPFGDPATGAAVAQAINAALAAALAANQFLDADGTPLTDPALREALQTAGARWHASLRQLTIASDGGTPSTGMRSSVELLPVADDLAPPLGFFPPAVASEGLQRIHRLPPPRSMTVEVRLDLWARSQGEMALMFDGLATAAPTRGRVALRPSLLAADVADGATQIRLLDQGEPTVAESLLHLEGGDGLTDRVRRGVYAVSGPAAHEAASARFRLSDEGRVTGPVWASPLAPDPLFAAQPAPAGFALSLGLQLDAGGAENDDFTLLSLTRDGASVFALRAGVVSVNVPGDGPRLFAEFDATARLLRGGVASSARTQWRLRLTRLEEGGTLHATVAAESGLITLAWQGEPQRLDDAIATPVAPTAVPGVPAIGPDMTLALGGGAGAELPQPVSISHVHLFAEPLGPLDPQLRLSVAPASRLRPGDMIAVAACEDGWRVGETQCLSLVDDVQGDRVLLTRPIRGSFARGRALVYQDECFFFQTAVKRRDDLMNLLYHCSLDYKVSALLEDPFAHRTAVLVRQTRAELTALGASRAAGGHPGVGVVDADAARVN